MNHNVLAALHCVPYSAPNKVDYSYSIMHTIYHAEPQCAPKAEIPEDNQTNTITGSNVPSSTKVCQESHSAKIGASDISNLSLQVGIGHSISQGHQPSCSSPYLYHNTSASSLATTQESLSTSPSSPVEMSPHGECVYNYSPQAETPWHIHVPQSSTNGQHVNEAQTKWYQCSDSSLYQSTPNSSSRVLYRCDPRKQHHDLSSFSEDTLGKQHWQPAANPSGPDCTSGKKPTRVPILTNNYQYNKGGEVPWSDPQLPVYNQCSQAYGQVSVPATNYSRTSAPSLGTPHRITLLPTFMPVGQMLAAGSNEKVKAGWGSGESNSHGISSNPETVCSPSHLLHNSPCSAAKSSQPKTFVREEENLSWSSTSSITSTVATESNQSSASGTSTLINSLSQSIGTLSTVRNSGSNCNNNH